MFNAQKLSFFCVLPISVLSFWIPSPMYAETKPSEGANTIWESDFDEDVVDSSSSPGSHLQFGIGYADTLRDEKGLPRDKNYQYALSLGLQVPVLEFGTSDLSRGISLGVVADLSYPVSIQTVAGEMNYAADATPYVSYLQEWAKLGTTSFSLGYLAGLRHYPQSLLVLSSFCGWISHAYEFPELSGNAVSIYAGSTLFGGATASRPTNPSLVAKGKVAESDQWKGRGSFLKWHVGAQWESALNEDLIWTIGYQWTQTSAQLPQVSSENQKKHLLQKQHLVRLGISRSMTQ
jgi:hypothetical protein